MKLFLSDIHKNYMYFYKGVTWTTIGYTGRVSTEDDAGSWDKEVLKRFIWF